MCVRAPLYPYEGHIIDFRLHGNVNDCKSGKCEAPSCGGV